VELQKMAVTQNQLRGISGLSVGVQYELLWLHCRCVKDILILPMFSAHLDLPF
jgi:hypothetical protein